MTNETSPDYPIRAKAIILENFGDGGGRRKRVELKRFGAAHDIWTQANETLSMWAESAPVGERFHKVEVTISYNDGSALSLYYPLQFCHWEDPAHAPDLGATARANAEIFAGYRRPEHFDAEQYALFLNTFGRRSRERHARLLHDYELPAAAASAAGPPPAAAAAELNHDFTETRPVA